MKCSQIRCIIPIFCGMTLLALQLPSTLAQVKTAQVANAGIVLEQLSEAFSGGHAVHEIQLSGDADWHAGSLEDSGSASFTVSSSGPSHMQLSLSASGERAETQMGAGLSASCQWSKGDGVAHTMDMSNCKRSVSWFMPALSLQPSQLPNSLTVTDLGLGTLGSGSATYRHLQSKYTFSNLPDKISNQLTERSTTDIGLNPTTLLPAVLMYSVHPDNGSPSPIRIEIRYSDYRTINGVQIPFLIQRYVNGSLQLEVHVNSAQVN